MKFRLFTIILIIILSLLLTITFAIAAGERKPIAKSTDSRFMDYGDGTILDTKTNLMWLKKDCWQLEGKWVNWYTASEFLQKINFKKYGGYSDWRFPTADEASTLYDRRKRNTDKDGDKVFIDRIFPPGSGWGTWTSEEKGANAVVVSYKDEGGRELQDKLNAQDAFIRPVRAPNP